MNTANLLTQEQETERARQMVERFVNRFDKSYRLLAYHAALPLVLTPELVNYLRVEFLRDENIPWVAEVDLLLSDLCRQVGYELYAMNTAVRAYLLERMQEELGGARMQEVAKSLIAYVKYLAQTNPYISPRELQRQQWAAMVYLDDQGEKAVNEIAQAFKDAASANPGKVQGLVSRSEMARLAKITQELAPQLSAYENLVTYARLVTKVLNNATDVDEEALRLSYLILPDVELTLPPEFVPGGEQSMLGMPISKEPSNQEINKMPHDTINVPNKIQVNIVIDMFRKITIIPEQEEIPFPQADKFERVINLLFLLRSKDLTKEEITDNYNFTPRQTNYYTDAGRYLGFINKYSDPITKNISFCLTEEGKSILGKDYESTLLDIIKKILQHEVFYTVFQTALGFASVPSNKDIIEIMSKSHLHMSESTMKRRTSTVRGWIEWIWSQIDWGSDAISDIGF